MRLTPLAMLLVSTAILAQDDPMETHLYNVEFLTAATPDHPGQPLGLQPQMVGTVADGEIDHSLLTGEDLINLIKTNVAEDSWEHVSSHITFAGGVLTVTNRKSVHERIT